MAYTNTFITVAPDSKVNKSEVPPLRGGKMPLHLFQYKLLTQKPYEFTQDELIFETHLHKNELEDLSEKEQKEVWDALFIKGHPCLRASPLTKRYGFGAHYNQDGKIAIYPLESVEYSDFTKNEGVKKIPAMRSNK